MTKIRFNRLLSVVLALAMLATMMSFVFTANAATTEAKKTVNVNNWTDLGLVDAVPNALDTTVTQNATTIYGAKGPWGADYAINACKVFDLSGGFTFSWTGNYQWNHYNGYYHAVSIGNLTIAAECIEGGTNKLARVHVIHNNNSNNLVLSPMSGRNGVTGVYGTPLKTVDIDSTKRELNFTVTVSGGKLSLTVGDSTGLSVSADNVNVSDIDFSAVTFGLKSIISDGIDWYKFTNPSLTYYKTVQLADKSVNNWTALGLVDAAPNAQGTTVTQNATTIYGAKGSWGADYAINASKEFDLSNGFTFSWTGNYQWNHYNRYYHAVSIGNLTIAAECIEGGTNKLARVHVIHNNNSNNRVLSPMSGRNGVTGVYGTTLKTVDIDSTKRELNFTVTVSGGKLSLTVGDSTGLSVSANNVDVSGIDFSAVTFGLKSIISDSIDWYKFTNPSLTYKKAVKLVDNNVNTWGALGLADAEPFAGVTVTVNDSTINGANGTWDGAGYGITASEEFDLSNGFTFTWSMGDNGYSSTEKNNSTKNAYNAISIGGITVASQRSGLGDGLGKVYVVKNEEKAADNSNRVIAALWWEHNTQVGVFGSVLASQTGLAGANNVKAYSLTVSADGKLSLTVAGTTICSDIDVSDVDFSAATFSVKSGVSYAGGSKYTNPSLTYKKIVKLADNFVVTKDGQGLVKCNGKNWIDRDVDAGTQVTLTAEAAYGYTFQGWVNGVNNTVVSTDPTLTVRANTTNNYTAVFVKNSGKYTVTVLNRFGKVVGTPASVAAGGKYTLPAAVDVTGYTFQGWQVKDSEDTTAYAAGAEYTVTGNVIFVPVYDVAETPTTYNINVTGGTADKANANYNELVTVTATVDNFGYWTKNGVVVSYSSTYSFYAGLANGNDINLVAVEATASAAPVTSIVNVYGSTAKVTFLMERSVPDDYSLVESGFILAKADFGTTDYMSAVDGTTVIKVAASNTSANGQYMLNVKTTSGNAIYAVSYVTYVDASGKLHTVYSSAASANAQ